MFERLVITGYSIFSLMMIHHLWNNTLPAREVWPMWSVLLYSIIKLSIIVAPFIAVGVIVWFVAVWIRKGKV